MYVSDSDKLIEVDINLIVKQKMQPLNVMQKNNGG